MPYQYVRERSPPKNLIVCLMPARTSTEPARRLGPCSTPGSASASFRDLTPKKPLWQQRLAAKSNVCDRGAHTDRINSQGLLN